MQFTTQGQKAGDFLHDLKSPLIALDAIRKTAELVFSGFPARDSERAQVLKSDPVVKTFIREVEAFMHGVTEIKRLDPKTLQNLKGGVLQDRLRKAQELLEVAKSKYLELVQGADIEEDRRREAMELLDKISPTPFEDIQDRIKLATLNEEFRRINLRNFVRLHFGDKVDKIEAPRKPVIVLAKPGHLQIAIRNLIANSDAFKRPEVEGYRSIRIGIDQNHAELEVYDNGTGTDQQTLAKLNQGSRASKRPGGTGRGTQLFRQTIHDHGGNVSFDSKHDPLSLELHGSWFKSLSRIPLHRE